MPHPTPHAKRNLDRSSRFCRIPRRYMTNRQTHRPTTSYVSSYRPHLCYAYTMRSENEVTWKEKDLSVVGKISGVYKTTTANAPVIPNLPIMLNVILMGTSDTSPANNTVKCAAQWKCRVWKMRERKIRHKIAGMENAGKENAAQDLRGGQCRKSGVCY